MRARSERHAASRRRARTAWRVHTPCVRQRAGPPPAARCEGANARALACARGAARAWAVREREQHAARPAARARRTGAMSVYNYVVTAAKPSAVTHSCVGNFTGAPRAHLPEARLGGACEPRRHPPPRVVPFARAARRCAPRGVLAHASAPQRVSLRAAAALRATTSLQSAKGKSRRQRAARLGGLSPTQPQSISHGTPETRGGVGWGKCGETACGGSHSRGAWSLALQPCFLCARAAPNARLAYLLCHVSRAANNDVASNLCAWGVPAGRERSARPQAPRS